MSPSMNKVRWDFFSPVVLQGLELEEEKRNLACIDRGSTGMEEGREALVLTCLVNGEAGAMVTAEWAGL